GDDRRPRDSARAKDQRRAALPRIMVGERVEDPVDVRVLAAPAAAVEDERVGRARRGDVFRRHRAIGRPLLPATGDREASKRRLEGEPLRLCAVAGSDGERQIKKWQVARAKQSVVNERREGTRDVRPHDSEERVDRTWAVDFVDVQEVRERNLSRGRRGLDRGEDEGGSEERRENPPRRARRPHRENRGGPISLALLNRGDFQRGWQIPNTRDEL